MSTTAPSSRPAPTPAPVSRQAGAPSASIKPAARTSTGLNPAPTPPKSRLSAIKRGRLRVPLRHLFYGPEGVGKSSLAADAPSPLFLDVEGGSPELDVARYKFRDEDDSTDHVPRSYGEVLAAVGDLIANPGHDFESLVIDTVDALEALIHRHICERDQKSGIESYGYGKGYRVALDEVRVFLAKLDTLRSRGMQVVLLGHSTVSTFKNPEGEDFDRYQLRLHQLAAGQIKEWCDVVGFVRFEGGGAKLKGDESQSKRARGWATGKRIVQLAREAAWDAKCRLSLPAELELAQDHPWRPFAEAKDGARDATVESLVAEAQAELARITGIDPEDAECDTDFVTAAGIATTRMSIRKLLTENDPAVLARVLAGLRATNLVTVQEP